MVLVETTGHARGKDEVVRKMRDMFEENDFVVERNVVEEHEVLVDLPYVANVRHDRQTKFLRQQADSEKFAHAGQALCNRPGQNAAPDNAENS